ncbi:SRPBCC family protein [Paraconexibacter sp.]|uniref:SRPBCC family protein n=1 Tax=Paraconexibacter sp. TaxID=2949640 RepID=UPI0035625C86
MGKVSAQIEVPGLTSAAEALWYDTSRWPTFIDGLAHVAKVEGDWPRAGGRVLWDAQPGGRGRVVELATAYEARRGQTVTVEDERIRGTQTIAFSPRGEGVVVTLTLDYAIKQERGVPFFVDRVFVRRPMRDSLRRTLARFARECRAEREGY